MLNAQQKQFTLHADGMISYQPDASNPLPGEKLAQIIKGDAPLTPAVELLSNPVLPNGVDASQAKTKIESWLTAHIAEILETLVRLPLQLEEGKELPPPVMGVCDAVYKGMGIIPREEVEKYTKDLDADMRQLLRRKQVRLGPILVFLPALNKPTAVRLRALLWSLYHGHPLPAPAPNDGMVSLSVEPETVDKAFYQAIGYPVFGTRAIRIDMLDRVICAVYDSAEGGKFKARHEMAEWLGAPISDLYAVLEAMGHRKIYDPADEESKPDEKTEQSPSLEPENKTPSDLEQKEEQKEAPQTKPELATFLLKRGKAFAGKAFAHKTNDSQKGQFSSKKQDGGDFKDKPRHKKKNKEKRKEKDAGPRVVSIGPKKTGESPFAILEQLKKKAD